MKNDKIVFVDMDGVLADFVGGVLQRHNLPEDSYTQFKGSYDIIKYLNMTPQDFWTQLDEDEKFWHNLALTPEANAIIDELESRIPRTNIFFLSSPALSPNCHYGKAAWVQTHFAPYLNRLILTGHKHLLSARQRYLIDDSDDNIIKFQKHGGAGILFPRHWNAKYRFAGNPMQIFKAETRRFLT